MFEVSGAGTLTLLPCRRFLTTLVLMPKFVFCGVILDLLPFLRTATVTPMTLPLSASMIGPPLLPGLMAASI